MQSNQQLSSTCCTLEGNLFLPYQLQQVFLGKNINQTPSHYNIPRGVTIKEECSRGFNIARAEWAEFIKFSKQEGIDDQKRLEYTTYFVKQLLQFGLGYQITETAPIFVPYLPDEASPEDRTFPVTHFASGLPLAIVSSAHTLDEFSSFVTYTNGDTKRKTAFQIIQELINGKPEYVWGFVSNGHILRLVHKAIALTRPCYVEFNLETMFNGGDYAEFFHMWEMLHASRTKKDAAGDNVWDLWVKEGVDSGQPAREAMGANLEEALKILGNGFLKTPGNEFLLDKLKTSSYVQDFQHQLLQLIYRFMFVFTLEERHILNLKDSTPENALARSRYDEGYAFHRFIQPARKLRFQNDYCDAWQSVLLVFKALDHGEPLLALPSLGGLFAADRCVDLSNAKLANKYFYPAMEKMRWAVLNGVLTTIDYKNMDTEELGSIYEGLLELIPQVDLTTQSFGYLYATGNERKSSGSYYTPDSLVQSLIKTALEPVIEQKLKDHPQNFEQGLLSLSVIDPACGSGHFLLAAARRIADKLAEVRAGNESVSPELYRKSLHDVIQHCIYGVDLNPMAVELTKIALWLEGYAEGTPLSFLDHHIKHGNALLGVYDVNMVKLGIPDDAYERTDKDIEPEFSLTQKDVCKRIKDRNRKERAEAEKHPDTLGFMPLFQNVSSIELSSTFANANERQKELIYAKYQEQLQNNPDKIASDLYIAAFLMSKTPDTELRVPTSNDIFKQLYAPDTLTVDNLAKSKAAAELCRAYNVFHWPFEFPEQCKEDKGFDCVLGNPPWEKMNLEETEWFINKVPEIARTNKGDERQKMIKALSHGEFGDKYLNLPKNIDRKDYEQKIYMSYVQDTHFFSTFTNFCHLSNQVYGRFPLTGVGITNLYAYFAELGNTIRNNAGSVGMVLPAGIISDNSTQAFSHTIFNGQIASVYHFDNTEKLFKDVDSRYSFVLLTLKQTAQADLVFYATNLKQLADSKRHLHFEPTDLKLFNPNTQTCIVVRSDYDLKLCRKLYHKAPILIRDDDPIHGNPWQIQTLQMFNMTTASYLFHKEKSIDNGSLVSLYEGKMFQQFDHRWASFDSKLNDFCDVTQQNKEQSNYLVQPRYWIDSTEVQKKLASRNWKQSWMLAWRDIGRSTDERTLIVSVLPSKIGLGHTSVCLFPNTNESLVACLLSTMNSLVVDFVLRLKQSGAHVSIFTLKQLPILSPEVFTEQDIKFICDRVAQLTRTADDINAVWMTDYPSYTFQKPEERLRLRAELDAYIARMYGLNREEVHYILDPSDVMGADHPSVTFLGLKRNQISEFGEYLTQRLVLEAFDKLEAGTLK